MRILVICLLCASVAYGQHPVAFAVRSDFDLLQKNLLKFPVLRNSYTEIKKSVDASLGKDVDVPFPKDPAGGYTHDRHKENYMLMFNAGLLYNITHEKKYAELVKNILLKYAALNPTLKIHPQATSNSPGHIFWQALNDANWLVYTGLAYDLIYQSLTASERKIIEDGAFKPEVDFITHDLNPWFNLIHNHGVWACAGVGIVGIATHNETYIKEALYGTSGDSSTGFFAQLDRLFSPDGYYTEGPYYVRYAILPFYLFANALQNARPDLKIFQYRDQILKKALMSGLQQTNIDGRFFPLNDILKEKDVTSNELVTAIDIAWSVYGKDSGLLTVAKKQNEVLLHKGGVSIAAELFSDKNIPAYFPYVSAEYVDGAKGDEGGVSLMRHGKDANLTTLIFKYASHGLSHGHYDQLGLNLFDKGNEILQDYGSVRFIGIEQKFGGRYLPENRTYSSQTIAHNTVVVDETSDFNAKEEEAEKYHGEKLFSNIKNANLQVVSAKEEHAYKNVDLLRTLYMISLPQSKSPLIVDLFRTVSNESHQYDLPFQYNGTVISTSFKYKAFTSSMGTLGKKNGYEFLWKEAEAKLKDSMAQFTFLVGKGYYSISSYVGDSAKIFFTRTGANDPDFNLRREPSYIIRKNGKNQIFLNVIEIHGKFDPIAEFSTNAYPSVQNIMLLRNDEELTVAEITYKGKKIQIAQCNADVSPKTEHHYQQESLHLNWTGPYSVFYDGKPL